MKTKLKVGLISLLALGILSSTGLMGQFTISAQSPDMTEYFESLQSQQPTKDFPSQMASHTEHNMALSTQIYSRSALTRRFSALLSAFQARNALEGMPEETTTQEQASKKLDLQSQSVYKTVPEPSTMGILGACVLLGLIFQRRLKQKPQSTVS